MNTHKNSPCCNEHKNTKNCQENNQDKNFKNGENQNNADKKCGRWHVTCNKVTHGNAQFSPEKDLETTNNLIVTK